MDSGDIQKAQQAAKIAQGAAAMGPAGWGAIGIGCGCLLILMLFMGTVALGVFALNNEDEMSFDDNTRFYNPEGLSDIVPPNFASLFTEAGRHTGVAPALVAAIFLTEKHTDSFGADLPSLDHKLEPCTENSSGAAGPMQFINSSWNGVTDDLRGVGISNPDRCKYRDSIIGSAFLLRGKLGFSWVKNSCGTTDPLQIVYNDDCISRWGQSYCGVPLCKTANGERAECESAECVGSCFGGCQSSACSVASKNYYYCQEVVRKFKLVTGG